MTYPFIILFDFDGVVITQRALEYSAIKFFQNEFFGWKNIDKLRPIDIARLFEESDSNNRIKAIIRAFKNYKDYIPSRWKRILFFYKYRRIYPKYEIYETLKPHLEDILIKLKTRGVIMGIVSNSTSNRLSYFREKLKLDSYFTVYISRDDTPKRKPTAYPVYTALLQIKREFGISIKKEKVFLLGDLPSDIKCAQNAGIKSIALLSGHGRREDLENTEPDVILENIQDIITIEPFKKLLLD
jgi:HAD superfamily hydrolase (TIGR01549 family)